MPGAKNTKHKFGGPWTEIKLDAIAEYLRFYQGALKNMGFETWYVDAFAGSGERHTKVSTGGLFEFRPISEEERVLDGSARKALQIEPPFAHYWFAETHKGRQRALDALRDVVLWADQLETESGRISRPLRNERRVRYSAHARGNQAC